MSFDTDSLARCTRIANDARIGCGNFLPAAIAASADPDAHRIFLDEPFRTRDGRDLSAVSLAELDRLANEEAAAYHAAGVVPSDPVAISLDDGFAYLVHFVALTRLGAIPALVNPNMRADLAGGFVARIGAVGLVASSERLEAMASALPAGLRFASSQLRAAEEPLLPAPHVHAPDEPVLLCHSSGTTGVPKAVTFLHHAFFHGIRERLREPSEPARLLSALPHSHSAGLAFPMLALLRDEPIMLVRGDGATRVLAAISAFRATTVVAFPHTFVDVAESDTTGFDLSSVRAWVNTGDAAHGRHIDKLVGFGGGDGARGSVFIDGLGSSEMGFSLFRVVHDRRTRHPARCVGTPLPFVDAVVLGPRGELLGPGVVGRLGIRSPTLTSGYWNDSVLSARSRVHGYWITGDLVMKDETGRFYHFDRITDAIETVRGPLYSLLTEELLLRGAHDLVDVAVFAAPGASTSGKARAIALVRPEHGVACSSGMWLTRLNAILLGEGAPVLDAVIVPEDWSQVPVGPTGKVRKTALRSTVMQELVA